MTTEIELNDQSFGPYVEGLPKLDPRIKSIEKMSSVIFPNPSDMGYILNYESEGHKGLIILKFLHDQELRPQEERKYGKHKIRVVEHFVQLTDKYSEDRIQDLIDWWNIENAETPWITIQKKIIKEMKFLTLEIEETATSFQITAVGEWIGEIMDFTPKIIVKAREVL